MYNFDFNIIIEYIPALLNGLKLTVFISVVSSILAFSIGILIAFARNQNQSFFKTLATMYVEVVRNTPLLIQIYLWYKGLPNFGIDLPPMVCGIGALSLYTGAFISEVIRAGINSIAHEQYQAARGLGLSKIQTYQLIVLPQAFRIVIPPLGSQFINLIKNSSLVSFITITDIFYVVYKGASDDFRFFEFFITGALIYMMLTGIVAIATNMLEAKYSIPGRAAKI